MKLLKLKTKRHPWGMRIARFPDVHRRGAYTRIKHVTCPEERVVRGGHPAPGHHRRCNKKPSRAMRFGLVNRVPAGARL